MIKKITPQRTFNAAWQAFIVEDKPPAIYGDGDNVSCYYNDGHGNCCAFGLVMPEDRAIEIGGGVSIDTVMNAYPELFNLDSWRKVGDFTLAAVRKAEYFQAELHDSLIDYSKRTWKFSRQEREVHYRNFAAKYKLSIPKGKTND
jgi:hypothetical protein